MGRTVRSVLDVFGIATCKVDKMDDGI